MCKFQQRDRWHCFVFGNDMVDLSLMVREWWMRSGLCRFAIIVNNRTDWRTCNWQNVSSINHNWKGGHIISKLAWGSYNGKIGKIFLTEDETWQPVTTIFESLLTMPLVASIFKMCNYNWKITLSTRHILLLLIPQWRRPFPMLRILKRPKIKLAASFWLLSMQKRLDNRDAFGFSLGLSLDLQATWLLHWCSIKWPCFKLKHGKKIILILFGHLWMRHIVI